MRLALVSDVHGNIHALESVIADLQGVGPDLVIQGGDVVVNGGNPNEVVSRIRELDWPGVVGNTDELLWKPEEFPKQLERMARFEPLLRVLYEHTGPATLERLSDENLAWLKALPQQFTHEDVTVLHASPNDLWRAPAHDADDQRFTETYSSLSSVVVYGHIHRPFVRRLPNQTVANSGSVGMTWDGDPRASYLLIEDGEVTVHRVEYPIDLDIKELQATDYPFAGWLAEMRRTGRYVPPDPWF